MNPTATITLEVRSLIEAVCDGMADDAQVRDLQSLLRTNEETCNFYVDLLSIEADLQWLLGSLQADDAAIEDFAVAQHTPPQQLAPTFLSTAFPATLGYSSGWSVAYLTATVITGLWILSMWLMPVSRQGQLATHSTPPVAERQLAPEPLAASVGRITGLVDCKRHSSSRVSLGQKLDLTSGLMEITYDTGAKVILQGPVTYEVEANGGYLSVGKLTGKLEKKAQTISTASPFVVHTPTAAVTDLGTEFGVEVSGCDSTRVCVFVGEVQVETAHRKSSRLTARQAVQITTGGVRPVPSSGIAERFVRTIRSPVGVNGSFSDKFVGRPSRHWINPQAASYVGGRALFDYGREDSDRVYLYTAGDWNYAAHDFVATVKITNAAGHAGGTFFGLGDGQKSGFFDEPGANPPYVYLMYHGSGYATYLGAIRTSSDNRATHHISAIGAKPAGTTIAARFQWAAATHTATFSIDANNDGVYDETVTMKCPDFATSETPGPSRLFIGGSGGASFSDFKVEVCAAIESPIAKPVTRTNSGK